MINPKHLPLITPIQSPFLGLNIYNINTLLTDQTLNSIIEETDVNQNLKWEEAEVYNDHLKEKVIDKTFRNSKKIMLPFVESDRKSYDQKIINHFEFHLKKIIRSYLNEFEYDDKNGYTFYEILKYGEGNFLSDHYDDGGKIPLRVSILYYLNDGYVGGNIEWKNLKFNYQPKKGDVIIFPSSYIYRHRVHPITSGTRYVITQFIY